MKYTLRVMLVVLQFFHIYAYGQSSLKGTVIDIETGEPIFGVNVFIENSTVGSTTDPDGQFIIKNIRGAFQNVVVSHAAYVKQVVALENFDNLTFRLQPSTRQLNDFQLEDSRDRKWKRFYNQFEEAFLGQSENAAQVTIQNPWVMELSKTSEDELIGYSFDMLEIDNMATGYHIKFLLEEFSKAGFNTSYGGKPLFTPMTTNDTEVQKKWTEKRRKTFLGSMQHFLYALANNRLTEEGFLIYHAKFSEKFGHFITLGPAPTEEILKDGILYFDQFLKVVYTKEKPEEAYTKDNNSITSLDSNTLRGASGSVNLSNRRDYNNQVSYLYFNNDKGSKVDPQGFLQNPKVLLEYGYWSWERIAELLPYEYRLDFTKN